MVERFVIRPEIDQDSEPYWASLRSHQARLQRCAHCGRLRFPPAPSCYDCGKEGETWELISGKGTIYSWIVIHHPVDTRLAREVPFVVALVELAEGPRMVGRLVGCERSEIKAAMPVMAQYDDIDSELTLLNFTPECAMSAELPPLRR